MESSLTAKSKSNNGNNRASNNSKNDETIPSKFQVWKLASRPHTLTASIVPVIVGYALTLQLIRRHSDIAVLAANNKNIDDAASCVITANGNYDEQQEEQEEQEVCTASNTTSNNSTLLPPQLLQIAIQFAVFASLIQISTNLHNDYADFVKGADTDQRVGQARATQKGWLTPRETCGGCLLCLLGAAFVGVGYLIPAAFSSAHHCDHGENGNEEEAGNAYFEYYYDPIMIFVVLSSMFNAVAYTGGPFPLGYIGLGNLSIGYSGLGDVFVFLYFGLVATLGVPYLYLTKVIAASCAGIQNNNNNNSHDSINMERLMALLYPSFLYALPIGFLGTAIIVVNNLRDRNTDIHAGKKTLAVRFGKTFCQVEYLLLIVGSYAFCVVFWLLEEKRNNESAGIMISIEEEATTTESSSKSWTTLLPLLSIPMAITQLKAVAFGGKDGGALNEHVGGTAKLQMMYCILMAAGLIISIQ